MNKPDLNKSVEVKNIVNIYFKNHNIQFKLYIKKNCSSLVPTEEGITYSEGNILTRLRTDKSLKNLFFWVDDKYSGGEDENKIEIPCINFAERSK